MAANRNSPVHGEFTGARAFVWRFLVQKIFALWNQKSA